MKRISKSHIKATERQISPGRWWEGPNQEAVRVVSHKSPWVRYAQHSYDGAICRTTAAHFLSRFKPITEEHATLLLTRNATISPSVVQISN
jgi:hypothetical protein